MFFWLVLKGMFGLVCFIEGLISEYGFVFFCCFWVVGVEVLMFVLCMIMFVMLVFDVGVIMGVVFFEVIVFV